MEAALTRRCSTPTRNKRTGRLHLKVAKWCTILWILLAIYLLAISSVLGAVAVFRCRNPLGDPSIRGQNLTISAGSGFCESGCASVERQETMRAGCCMMRIGRRQPQSIFLTIAAFVPCTTPFSSEAVLGPNSSRAKCSSALYQKSVLAACVLSCIARRHQGWVGQPHTLAFNSRPHLSIFRSAFRRPLTALRVKKVRVDELLVQQGLAADLKHAAALIMAGSVIANETIRVKSPAEKLVETTVIRLRGQKTHGWVSRGGVKLEHGVNHFNVKLMNRTAIDVGCSTGGFTHVLLHGGARRVYAVDVGYNLLDLSLREDPRVGRANAHISLTHIHARALASNRGAMMQAVRERALVSPGRAGEQREDRTLTT